MLNRITFFSSVEFPTTASSPTIAFPLINAQCLISAFFPIIAGPCMYAVGATVADFAIHTSSPILSYSSGSSVFPNSIIKSFIFGNTSHGYVAPSNIFLLLFHLNYIDFLFYILPYFSPFLGIGGRVSNPYFFIFFRD